MQKLGLWTVVAAIVLVLGISIFFGSRPLKSDDDLPSPVPSKTAVNVTAKGMEESQDTPAASDKGTPAKSGTKAGGGGMAVSVNQDDPSLENVRKLQDLMDEVENNKEAAFIQAKSMLKGTLNEKIHAINALEWIGGSRSVIALSAALNDSNPDLSSLARRAIENILTKAHYSDAPEDQIEREAWDAIIESDPGEDNKFVYFQKMVELPSLEAVPLLARYLDSPDESTRKLAREYIKMAAYGEEITTKEQADTWVKEEEKREKADKEASATDLVVLPDDTDIGKSLPEKTSTKKSQSRKIQPSEL